MNISSIFIERKVMTTLVMVAIAFFGIASYRSLPVSSLPNISYPTISVSISYPGASPETVANNVVTPLEQEFATIGGIESISSTSSTGSGSIVLQFKLDKNIDVAATDVQSAITAASAQLPQGLPYAPTYQKVDPTATSILFYTLKSNTMSLQEIYDYAHSVIGQRLSIVDGVSQVNTFGQPFAVRIQIDPQKLAIRNLGIDQVAEIVQQSNVNLPIGTLYGPRTEYTLNANGLLTKAEQYDTIILQAQNGSILRLKDVSTTTNSLQNDKQMVRSYSNGQGDYCVGLGILKQDGANAIDVIDRIEKLLPSIVSQLPQSLTLEKKFDESIFIVESIDDVKITLLIAIALVVIVIFLYLGKFIETLIPAIAIPISILGTFAVMKIMGFNVDILSLLAITLSIGFLVDDAIVVLENIVRHVELGDSPLDAAIKGSKEIFPTIISMTLCLVSVFIPLLFMGGIIGRLLHEFSLTIVSAVLFSGLVSLTLTPLLCSKLIPKRKEHAEKKKIEILSDSINEKLLSWYKPALAWSLTHKGWILGGGIISFIFTVFLLVYLPKDFLPGDDIGLIEGFTVTIDGTSPYQIALEQERLSIIASQNPYVDSVISVSASPQDNQAVMYVCLKPFKNRPNAEVITKQLSAALNTMPGVLCFLKPLPLINLQVGTTSSTAAYQYTMQSLNEEDLYTYAPILQKKLATTKGFSSINSDLDVSQPQVNIEILRDKASMLGISANQIETVLGYAFAGSNLSNINMPNNLYYVIAELLPQFYKDPQALSQIWLTTNTNPNNLIVGGPAQSTMVPLSSIVKITESIGPLTINHLNGLPSATISFNISGMPLEKGLELLQDIAKETLPSDVSGNLQGTASIFKSSFANLTSLVFVMLFIVYVILGILYENFFPPITVMSTLPPAALGALLTLMLFKQALSLYAVVGIILLLGIVMKNGIIMIDFASERREKERLDIYEAITQACTIRFRPILMTTFCALMGSLPIAIGFGGMTASSRRPLGLAIVGGLIISQVLTLFFTPVVYCYIELLEEKINQLQGKNKSPPTIV